MVKPRSLRQARIWVGLKGGSMLPYYAGREPKGNRAIESLPLPVGEHQDFNHQELGRPARITRSIKTIFMDKPTIRRIFLKSRLRLSTDT